METRIIPDDTGGFNVRVTDGPRYRWLGHCLRGDVHRNLVNDRDDAFSFNTRIEARCDIENWLTPGHLAKMTVEEWKRYLEASKVAEESRGRKMTAQEYRQFRDAYLRDAQHGPLLF